MQNKKLFNGSNVGDEITDLSDIENDQSVIFSNVGDGTTDLSDTENHHSVIVGKGSVISMGVYIGQSTKIYDRTQKTVSYGYIPPGSVVVSGNLPAEDGSHSLYCAVIVKKVDEKTRAKTSINDLLRI